MGLKFAKKHDTLTVMSIKSERPNAGAGKAKLKQEFVTKFHAFSFADSPKVALVSQVTRRLEVLREEGVAEGTAHSLDSQNDLRAFVTGKRLVKPPKIFLLDNGNFRAVWYGDTGEQLGLQFRGKGIVQWVAFARDCTGTPARSGQEVAENLDGLIALLQLEEIVFE